MSTQGVADLAENSGYFFKTMAGNIKIIEPREHYQKVSKEIIFSDSVDVLTLGVYVKVLTLGKKWQLNVKGLAKTLNISADKIRASFATLEEAGYLRRTRVQGDSGHFTGWDYEVASEPFTDIAKTPTSVKSERRKNRTSENDTQYRDYNEDGDRKEKQETVPSLTPPTPSEVADYVRNMVADPEGFALYFTTQMTNNGWTYGKKATPVKNWKNNVLQWVRYHKTEDFSFMRPQPSPAGIAPATIKAEQLRTLIP